MQKDDHSQLDLTVADQMLSNIFDVCNLEGNRVPLQVLSTAKNYRKEKNYVQRAIAGLILVVLLLLPILFVTPHIVVDKVGYFDGRPAVWLAYSSLLPANGIQVTSQGQELPVHETRRGHYLIYPKENGELQVKITLVNGQWEIRNITVSNADHREPELIRVERVGEKITAYVTDESGALDIEGCFALTPKGAKILPDGYSERPLSVSFRYPGDELEFYLPDKSGNVLRLSYNGQ